MREKKVQGPMQLIFKVAHFMIAVIMMQGRLTVAAVDEVHVKASSKTLLYNAAKGWRLTHKSA